MKALKKLKFCLLTLLFACLALCAVACGGNGGGKGGESVVPTPGNEVSIIISQDRLVFTQFDVYALNARMSDNSSATFTWTSSDDQIVSVSSEGLLTAVNEGSATITVSNGKLTATCAVTVERSNYFPSLKLSQTTAKVEVGSVVSVYADVMFMGASVKDMPTITWSADNSAVVSINAGTGYARLTGTKIGRTVVRANTTYRGRNLEAAVAFDVVSTDVYSMGVKQLQLYTTEYGTMKDQYTIVDTFNGGAIPGTANVTFTSEDTSIVTVNSDGVIKSVGVGVTRVNALLVYGDVELTDSCIVNVAITSIDLNKTIDIFLTSADGDQTFTFADLGLEKQDYQWFEATKDGNKTLSPVISGNNITFSFTIDDSGEKETHLLIENEIDYIFNMAVITKVIKTAAELLNIKNYNLLVNQGKTSQTWDAGDIITYSGYFVLGNNIDLTGQTISTQVPLRSWEQKYDDDICKHGFIGTFNGRNYTLYGGTYVRGLFGFVGTGAVIKNVAIVNATFASGMFNGIFGANIQNATIDNVLIDVTNYTSENYSILGEFNGSNTSISNTVIYCAGSDGKVLPSVASFTYENVYVISDNATGATQEGISKFAAGTTCANVGFTGLGSNWVLTGSKARFASKTDI